ncbi:glutathione S-transferase N-terminal domain-containing protein [Pleomorphomonas oryzae]|uniref:glutathione S-transferase N-terminal domain-containing protein n=1 Tax=Pleomorphomonas oryzae TaxID=261934 RepID=UPI0003FD48BD|nr:glutathione S-transferase N-terminal domain-containing protein [Pleomorphomonas oryzae]
MLEVSSKPVLFVKHTCPFCLKLRLYLLEAGLLDSVILCESRTPEEEEAMRAELSPHLAKVSYPTARFGEEYMTESDDIIARFARNGGRPPEQLPTYQAYVDGPFAQLLALHRENAELKQQA